MFDSVHSPIRSADDFVEDGECSLERSEFNERFEGFGVYFA